MIASAAPRRLLRLYPWGVGGLSRLGGGAWLLAAAGCIAAPEPDELVVPDDVHHDAWVPRDELPVGEQSPATRSAVATRALGRFAVVVQHASHSSCSQSWGIYNASASFVLDLAEGGTATACRGRRSIDVGGGWDDTPREFRQEEQQGLAGRWTRMRRGWIEVKLAPAAAPCSQVLPHTGVEPESWTLRCKVDSAAFDVPVLACRISDEATNTLGYTARYGEEGAWILLGAGDGIVVDQHDDGYATEAKVEAAPRRITLEAWKDLPPREPITPSKGGPRVLMR